MTDDPQRGSVAYLMERVQRRLSQVSGPGVHLTTEDSIVEHLISSFYTIFNEYWWPSYTTFISSELDKVLGVPVIDLSAPPMPLVEFYDIREVIPDQWEEPLRRLPDGFIPSKSTGTRPEYIIPYPERPDKVFRVVPYTSEGLVHIKYRSRPTNIDIDTVLRVDEEYLVAAATFLYLADDGTNPGATSIAEQRLLTAQRTVRDLLYDTIPLESFHPSPVTYWWSE